MTVVSCSSEGGASVPVSVVQEGHKLSVTGAEWEEGGGYSLHVEVPIVYDVTVATSGQGDISCRDMIESHYCHLTSDQGDITITRCQPAPDMQVMFCGCPTSLTCLPVAAVSITSLS